MTSTQKFFISLFLLVLAASMALASLLYTSSRPISNNIRINETNSDVKKSETEPSTTSLDTLPETTIAPTPVSILAVGDIMLGRYVQTLMEKHGEDYPFEKIGNLFNGHDVVLANLEGPLQDGPKTPNDSLVFRFPETSAPLLARHGITHVSLANNHTLNQGQAGLESTRALLVDVGVSHFGDPLRDGEFVVVEDIGDTEIAWIGANAAVRTINAEEVTKAIHSAKSGSELVTSSEPVVILLVHWGNEYQHTPSAIQRELAHEWIDAGADVVIGHHPHVIQTVELYNDHMIFYSLGNFIFDQYFSQDTQEMLAVNLLLDKETVTAKLIPLTSLHSQPQIAETAARTEILNKLANWSDPSIRPAIINGEFILKREER